MYDVVIIGSGIGGLLCGNILAMKGRKVCVIEKNKQIGGNLQTFSRNKQIFDTGVHYIGGLDKGQTLHQIFKYVDILDNLKLQKMDACVDKVLISNEDAVYPLYQGYDYFIEELAKCFPDERNSLITYCDKVKATCKKFPLYNLQWTDEAEEKIAAQSESVKEVIEKCTTNKRLQAVLAGNNMLYAGEGEKTPFHVHALIVNSYIESSWKCIDGGSQIAKRLAQNIQVRGGIIMRNTEVKHIIENEGKVDAVITEANELIRGSIFISNASPSITLQMLDSNLLKPAYRKRIEQLKNAVSSFSLYIVLKEKSMMHHTSNYYYHKEGRLWDMMHHKEEEWPLGYGMFFTQDKKNPEYASSIAVLTYMRYDETIEWATTNNTTRNFESRGEAYESFKQRKTEQLLDCVAEKFTDIRKHIHAVYSATPLTNRDYIGLPDGSMYGIQKDYREPLKTMISPRTKIPNLFLTGQNLNLHGILGTSLSAVLTCSMILDDYSLIDSIKNA